MTAIGNTGHERLGRVREYGYLWLEGMELPPVPVDPDVAVDLLGEPVLWCS